MKTTPLLLGAAVLFWGWHTDLLPFAATIALLLEGSRLVAWRWNVAAGDFRRVADGCALVFLALAVYLYSANQTTRAILTVIQWLPLVTLPLVALQVYSMSDTIPLNTVFLSLRRKAAPTPPRPWRTINLAYPYLVLCLAAAGAANVRGARFYLGFCLLLAWALWPARSPRDSALVWGGSLALVVLVGYAGHVGLHDLQRHVGDRFVAWFTPSPIGEADAARTRTAIGEIGALKLSDRIVLRVEPGRGSPPLLLREASYTVYASSTWWAARAAFESVRPERDGTTWALTDDVASREAATISAYLRDGRGFLALPTGTTRIESLPVTTMERSPLGAVRVDGGPRLVAYRVRAGPASSLDAPPGPADLAVPPAEASAVARVAGELDLASKSPADMLDTVAEFFRQRFTYSTYASLNAGDREPGATALGDFLLRSRSGHCEYFAAATVLLLRAAGIPARYATGYSVQEFSRLEKAYVVRDRHAHAWALVYHDGAWRDFDTTPPGWVNAEQAAASIWEPVADAWSRAAFLFTRWRARERTGGVPDGLAWVLIPLLILLGWRLYAKKRVARLKTTAAPRVLITPGADSEWYRIARRLEDLGMPRQPGETQSRWVARLDGAGERPLSTESLRPILDLHDRYRFDPAGVSDAEKEVLKSGVHAWLERHQSA
ncbi:MAG: transglutaminase domain-containing protein [Nitrospirae bacterium]|nr:transglutaminase domain-containing protein [Nitrospirota bacterium]